MLSSFTYGWDFAGVDSISDQNVHISDQLDQDYIERLIITKVK